MTAERTSSPARLEDTELVERCLAGDRAAQRTLFEREKRRVHATLYRIVGHNRGIDDMLQDTFIAVFGSLSQFRGEARLSTWIDRCAVHVAYRHLRSQRRAKLTDLDESLQAQTLSAECRMGLREATLRLYEVLDMLDAKQRIAYTLHVIQERPMNEVAALTGASVVATKVRVWRARRFLEQRARKDALLADFVRHETREAQAEEADA